MQRTISSTTASACWRSIPPLSMLGGEDARHLIYSQLTRMGGTSAVPGSPGRVSRLRPYPPSCGRQQ